MSLLSIPALALLAFFFYALGFFLFACGDEEMTERMYYDDNNWSD